MNKYASIIKFVKLYDCKHRYTKLKMTTNSKVSVKCNM